MTVVVLAIDALDAELVEYFGVDAFRLGSSSAIETFAHSKSQPYTPEVWATVATGVGPEEHGVTKSGTSEWDNSVLELGSRLTGHLPENVRGSLGKIVRDTTGERERLGSTDRETIFDGDARVVRNWPGVGDGRDLQYAWDLMNAVADDMPKTEFERKLLGQTSEQFGWVREMLRHELSVVGTHVHALDAAGHAYNDDERALGEMYERVGEFVAGIRSQLAAEDELLLLSDHGMYTTFLESDRNKSPGSHSWRAYSSGTTPDVPQSVYDVYEWVNRHASAQTVDRESIEMPVDQLRELGYME